MQDDENKSKDKNKGVARNKDGSISKKRGIPKGTMPKNIIGKTIEEIMKGKQNTNGFKQNPKNAGRGPHNLKNMLEERTGMSSVSREDLLKAQAIFLNMSEGQLLEIIECEDKTKFPAFAVIMATNMYKSIQSGDVDTTFRLIERIMGKTPQDLKIEAEVKQTNLNLSALDIKDLEALNGIITKIDDAGAAKEEQGNE